MDWYFESFTRVAMKQRQSKVNERVVGAERTSAQEQVLRLFESARFQQGVVVFAELCRAG